MDQLSPVTRPNVPIDPDASRWDAVYRRDASADGRFVYSVMSTGVYCRPGCPARLPLRRNVAFHATAGEAERAGFRPCERCRPNEPSQAERHGEAVADACGRIDAAVELGDAVPTLAALARGAGMSVFHFHRVFQAVAGVTPRGYAAALRAERLRERLPGGGSVTRTGYDAGYSSSGRLYEGAASRLGMRPSAYRDGGAGAAIRFAVGECSLGSVLVAATEQGVCAIAFGDDPEALVKDLQDRFPKAALIGADERFEASIATVVAAVEGSGQGLDLPLDVRGTVFQAKVWRALREIPPGETASYAAIAERIGRPGAVRAVAQACAQNPVALAIPCHRVVRRDGALGGYRWGVERKRELLGREARRPALGEAA